MVKNRLQWWCEHNNIIPKNQSGFRKGKSCSGNLRSFPLHVDEALLKKKSVLAAFLDVSSAFPNVQSDILLKKLAKQGFSLEIIIFVHSLTYERCIYTELLGDDFIVSGKGLPQEGVLSPFL